MECEGFRRLSPLICITAGLDEYLSMFTRAICPDDTVVNKMSIRIRSSEIPAGFCSGKHRPPVPLVSHRHHARLPCHAIAEVKLG